VEEDEIRGPAQVAVGLLQRCAQPGRVQGVLCGTRSGEIADLGGDRVVRQQISGDLGQSRVGGEVAVVEAGVDGVDAQLQRVGQETALVTRPV